MKNNTLSMPSWLKIAIYLLLASLVTLSFKKPTLFGSVNINDLFLVASFLCLLIAIYRKQIAVILNKKVVIGFIVAFGSIVLGTLISAIFFHAHAPIAPDEYARLIADMIICFELYVIGTHDATFIWKAIVAIIIPSILLPFLLYAPYPVLSFVSDPSLSRFSGFLIDPNYYASFQILPTFLLLWVAFLYPYGKKFFVSIIAFVLFIFSIASIIWSGSRGGFFGLVLGMFALALFMLWKLPFKKAAGLGVLIILGCIVSFFIIPKVGKQEIISRVATIQTPAPSEISTAATTVPTTGTSSTSPVVQVSVPTPPPSLSSEIPFTGRQDRLNLWHSSLYAIAKNPLGYGAGYYQIADIQGANSDHHRVAHNTILEIILTGGIILLVTTSIGAYELGKRIILFRAPLNELHYLSAALVGILGASLFLDTLPERWVWVTIGMILVILNTRPLKEHS